MKTNSKSLLIKAIKLIRKSFKNNTITPLYRVAEIRETDANEFEATIQIIGKNLTFKAKPEEILADDKMTDGFSQRDVRTLTYLGYLGINSPKYRILAKRLADNEQIVFAVRKKGSKKVELKTAKDISQNQEILKDLPQADAHMVGYATASENMIEEKIQKEKALSQLANEEEKKIEN